MSDCPCADQLLQLLEGQLDPIEEARVAAHNLGRQTLGGDQRELSKKSVCFTLPTKDSPGHSR
jgi:hypothetical protein